MKLEEFKSYIEQKKLLSEYLERVKNDPAHRRETPTVRYWKRKKTAKNDN